MVRLTEHRFDRRTGAELGTGFGHDFGRVSVHAPAAATALGTADRHAAEAVRSHAPPQIARQVAATPTEGAPESCGPDVTSWFVGKMNSEKSHPLVRSIQSDLTAAQRVGKVRGYSASKVLEGQAALGVRAAEFMAGEPERKGKASSQLEEADPENQLAQAGVEAAVEAAVPPLVLSYPKPVQRMFVLLARAGYNWKSLVETGAVFDFKNNILSAASLAASGCPAPCPATPTVTLCGACYEHDLPGNLFYAYIGNFCGFSLNALQLGSQFAELLPSSSGGWDPPEDTAAIDLGFNLPPALDSTSLCDALRSAGSSVTIRRCAVCAKAFP
jgi:hypothetical protein